MYKLHTVLHNTARTFFQATQHVKTPPTNLEVSLVDGSREDSSPLVELYSATYLREEPMVRAAGLTDLTEMKGFVSAALLNQHSVLLREMGSGELVAAASGGPVTHSTSEHLRLYAERSMTDARSQRLINLWAAVTSEANLLHTLQMPAVWDVSFLATAPRMRRLGLAQFLVAQQRRLAAKLGYGAVSLYCACPLTAQLAQKLRCQRLDARPLDSFKDPEGRPWVAGEGQVEVYCCLLRPRGSTQPTKPTQPTAPDWGEVAATPTLPNLTGNKNT